MNRRFWIAQAAMAMLVLGLLWLAGLLGSSVPVLHRLATSVDGLILADYHADPVASLGLHPLTNAIYADAYRDALGTPPLTSWTWYGNQTSGAPMANAPTPAPTQTIPQSTPGLSPTPTPAASPVPSPSGGAGSATPTPSPSATPSPAVTPTPVPVPTPTASPTPPPSLSPTPKPANTVVIASGQTWNGNLNITGKSVIIYGAVTGDVTVSGGSLTVYGTAGHDVTVTNGNASIYGIVEHNLTVQTGDLFLASSSWVGLNVTVSGGTLTRQSGSYVGGTVSVH